MLPRTNFVLVLHGRLDKYQSLSCPDMVLLGRDLHHLKFAVLTPVERIVTSMGISKRKKEETLKW